MKLVRRWWVDRGGATAIEYGVIIGVLTLLILGGLNSTYNAVQVLFQDNNNKLVRSME